MQSLKTEVLRLRVLGRPAYIILGENKTNTLFRNNTGLTIDFYLNLLVDVMFGPTKRDYARFAYDTSGRAKVPLPGTEHIAPEDRLWTEWHHIFVDNLTRTKPTNELAARFFDNFMTRIAELFKVGEWDTILVRDFLVRHQTDCAARALYGTRLFEKNPGLLDLLKEFELTIVPIAFGPPRWLNPKPYRIRDQWLNIHQQYMREALEEFDWNGPEAESAWEPIFGSPLIRQLVRWGLDKKLDIDTIAGFCGIQVSNQNTNSVPASIWSVIDVLMSPDPELLKNVRREAEAAITVDEKTGKRSYDIQKLVTSPWLQAVYLEVLRMRTNFSITRDAIRDTEIDGIPIPKGSLVQAPIPIAHYSNVWEAEGYPASEFWPHRHVKTVEAVDEKGNTVTKTECTLGNRSGYWFPYGGGHSMCPGRHFAKQEIIATLAYFVTQFDIEVVGYVMPDGSPSDRPPKHGTGFIVFSPDRDLKVRVKRLW